MSSKPQRPSVIAEPDAEAIGGDRELVLAHMPKSVRDAFGALFAIDVAMGDVVARATEPALAAIKLAWWRERLEALDTGPPPAEPRLRAIADHLIPQGISGSEIAGIERGWATLLDPDVNPALVAGRGALLFSIGGRLLGAGDPKLDEAGGLWALVSVARRGVPELLDPAKEQAERIAGCRFAKGVRPLTGLARLAARDVGGKPFEPEASPRRAAALLAHRWSGVAVRGG